MKFKSAKIDLLLISWLVILCQVSLYGQQWKDTLVHFSSDTAKLDFLTERFNASVYASSEEALRIVECFDSLAVKVDQEKYFAQAQNIRGMTHYVKAEYDEAIEYLVRAVTYFETAEDNNTKASVFNNLSTCYQVTGDMDKSINFSLKALLIFESLNDTTWIANVNSNLGLLYLKGEKLDEAETHLNIAIPLLAKLDKNVSHGIALLNRGNLNVGQGKYPDAIADYEKSMRLIPEKVIPLAHAAAKAGIGNAYNALNRNQLAIKYLKQSLKEATAIDHKEQMQEANKELSAVYEKTGNFRQALLYDRAYNVIKDEVTTAEREQKVVDIMTQYETAKKEQEIIKLNATNELNATKLKAKNRQVIGLLVGGLLLLGFLVYVYQLNARIKDQHRVISKTLNEKDTLLREIHHRVKNNLQVISSLLALQSKYIKDDTAIDALQSGQDRVQSMALIHQDLYQADNLKGVDTELYLEQLIENLFETYKINEEDIRLETEIDSILLDVDTMIPLGLVVNELISNTLKHAFPKNTDGIVSVKLKDEGETLFLNVSDNGQGLEDIDILKQKSFGYSLVESFSHKLDADIETTSVDGLSITLRIKRFKRSV